MELVCLFVCLFVCYSCISYSDLYFTLNTMSLMNEMFSKEVVNLDLNCNGLTRLVQRRMIYFY
jgi:hypothetical protein